MYERIAQFVLGRPSVIPVDITRYNGTPAQRDSLYRSLKEESDAMSRYFGLFMTDPAGFLIPYLATSNGSDRAKKTKWTGVGPGTVPGWQDALRQIQKDYTTLTGRSTGPKILLNEPGSPNYATYIDPCAAGMCYPTPPTFSKLPGAKRTPDAPFKDRDPQKGFLSFDYLVVSALMDKGFTWGGIGFGGGGLTVGGSGDVMHFELSAFGKQVLADTEAAVSGL